MRMDRACNRLENIFERVEAKNNGSLPLPAKIVWLGGAPGAGKGTNSAYISSALGITSETIVMSSLLESDEAKAIKAQGGMVDDNVVFNELLKEMCKPQYSGGVVVDGFPRSATQVRMISALHDEMARMGQAPQYVFVMLYIDEEGSVQRQLVRGERTKRLNSLRAAQGLSLLEERATDLSENYAHKRYQIFQQEMANVMNLASAFPLVVIDTNAPTDTVRRRIKKSLRRPC